jgi:hypothetical protein
MFRQFSRLARVQAEHCADNAWVHLGTHHLSTPDELQRYLALPNRDAGAVEEAVAVFGEQEHLYPNSASSSAPLAVLYGQIGTPSFAAFHALLRCVSVSVSVSFFLVLVD